MGNSQASVWIAEGKYIKSQAKAPKWRLSWESQEVGDSDRGRCMLEPVCTHGDAERVQAVMHTIPNCTQNAEDTSKFLKK
jgi:hypothetical protein